MRKLHPDAAGLALPRPARGSEVLRAMRRRRHTKFGRSPVAPGAAPGLALLLGGAFLTALADVAPPPYRELYELIRQHAPGIPERDLDDAASGALLERVRGRILTATEVGEPLSTEPALADRRVYDQCAYVRIGQVTLALAPQLDAALHTPELADTRGLILDLRFATGADYQAAANVVNLFVPAAAPLLSWDGPAAASVAKTNAWVRPVTVLVNGETRGGAEAVAAALRQLRIALLIGGRTAGVGAVFQEIPLGDSGRRLRLAVAAVKTADGQPLPAGGLEPDLPVNVRPEHERAYLLDPFTIVLASARMTNAPVAGTNRIASSVTVVRRRTSEADLVRQKRAVDGGGAGENPGNDPAIPAEKPSGAAPRPTAAELGRVIKDPVLGRALDLLKGLALLGDR